ncbi:MAG: hypothetical protein ACE363_11915 [Alphaproteobacteria bacterium]
MRGITVITLALLVAVSYGLYRLKYTVEDQRDSAAAISAQIAEDQRAIKVLRAEWAYLTRPQRLQDLSGDFLDLAPLDPDQIGELDVIPARPLEPLPEDTRIDTGQLSQVAP